MQGSNRRRGRAAAAAVSLLVLLAFGLPRMLVVCTGPHCEARLEWVHGRDACCDHDDAAAGHDGDGDAESAAPGHGDCTDVPLALQLGPRPEPAPDYRPEPPVVACTATPALPALRATPRPRHRPPATGPPRADRRTALRATTLLLI